MKKKKTKRDNADRNQWTEEERQAEHKIRMRFEYRDLIEDLIQEGQERGVFDNLPGQGKPLDLEKNVYEGDRKLANELMKEHNLLPLWLMKRSAIYTSIEELRGDIYGHWHRHRQAYRLATDDGRRRALSLSWYSLCRNWEQTIIDINKLIDDFNLRRPSDSMEIFKLRLPDELNRAGAQPNLNEQP